MECTTKLVKGKLGNNEGISGEAMEHIRAKRHGRRASASCSTEKNSIQGHLSSLVVVLQQTANNSEVKIAANDKSTVHVDLLREQELDKLFELTLKASERVEAARKMSDLTNDNRILRAAQLHYQQLMQKYQPHRNVSGDSQEKEDSKPEV